MMGKLQMKSRLTIFWMCINVFDLLTNRTHLMLCYNLTILFTIITTPIRVCLAAIFQYINGDPKLRKAKVFQN